jgi:arabinofuranan 3-O-arabinosyltransferase
VRLDVREPAWLVLGQSYNDAWRASCDGRDLGAPRPVDGYAMGWRVAAGCERAEMRFAPDSLVRAGYLVSLPFLLAMLGLVVVRRPPEPEPMPDELPEPRAERLPVGRAAALALLAGAALGFVFAARATPLIALGTFLILWRGVGVRRLVAAAGGLLLVAVPVLTLAIGVKDRGGYNPEYAQVRIAVHWVAVAAVILLVLALARVLGAARRRRSPA